MGKGTDAERMLFTAPKVIATAERRCSRRPNPAELAAFYTPAKQHAPSTYLIALQLVADQYPLGAECALASRALVRLLVPIPHHRRFDRGIWRHPAHCSDQGTLPPMSRDAHARASAATRPQRRRYRMSIFAQRRNSDDKMVRGRGSCSVPCDAYSI
jgi:hypothetical protein